MTLLDGRARKNPVDPDSVELISRIVAEGESRGWLRQFRINDQPGAEYVWLYQLEHQLPFPPEDISSAGSREMQIATRPVAESADDVKGSEEYPSATASEAPNLRQGAEAPSVEQKASEEVNAGALSPTKLVRRAELMEAKLRERGIGSPALAREYLFAAVEEIIASNGNHATAQLISKAREQARRAYETEGQVKEQNWNAIADCFLRMLLTAEVLLKADESPIRNGIGAYSARVSKLVPNFRDRCEAALLEVVIKKMGDISYSDLYDLGLTLFHKGKEFGLPRETIVERTDFLLELLQQEDRIEIDDDGRLLTTSPTARAAGRLTAV